LLISVLLNITTEIQLKSDLVYYISRKRQKSNHW